MGVQPLGDLVALIEQTTGADVAVVEADGDEHGLAMKDPETGAVFVPVAKTRHPMRQRSTLAHELGHLVFGDWDPKEVLSSRSPAEARADAFACHLLVPKEGLEHSLATGARLRKQSSLTLCSISLYLLGWRLLP